MEPYTTTAIIAGLALLLGMFNFWWTHLRKRKSLYLVQIRKAEPPGPMNFALVNAGTKDVLVTGVFPYLEDDRGGRFTPSGVVEHGAAIVSAGQVENYRLVIDRKRLAAAS